MTPIIDPHIHLWDHRNTPRQTTKLVKLLGWNPGLLQAAGERLFPSDLIGFFGKPDHVLADYLGSDYARDTQSRHVAGFVHVQAGWEGRGPMAPVGETRWLESLGLPRLKGIVGHADLALGGAAGPVLKAHLEASPRFRGVRYMLAHHPDPGVHSFCERHNMIWDAQWRAGYALLAQHGLSFDAWCYHHQLRDVAALARDVPEVPIILCHLGSPVGYAGPFSHTGHLAAEREAIAARWREDMQRLAEHENVYIKLSGVVMPVLGWDYHSRAEPRVERLVEQLGPMVRWTLDTFGAHRCMFASNFPVDKASLSWSTLFQTYEAIVAERSEEEKRALFYDTARQAYRLEL